MKKMNITKWLLPALLMSAMILTFMPGSVQYYTKDPAKMPEGSWNFFTPPVEGTATSCLVLAGMVTMITMVLAVVALCFKKHKLYKPVAWCSLVAGSLAAVPYMMASEEELVQPNVAVLLILLCTWLMALYLDKKKDVQEQTEYKGPRLK